jgi:FG-GAP-like repeat/FG-GAP repeat
MILLAALLPIEIACGAGGSLFSSSTAPSAPPTPAGHQYATGKAPTSVAAADFNGDKILDLAVTNSTDNTVSVLLGNGDGTFRQHVDYPADKSLAAVAVADINGDGKQDLVVAGSYGGLLLGNRDGTFQAMAQLPTTGYSPDSDFTAVAVGDLNGDGKLDLVFVSPGFGNYDQPDGGFSPGGGEMLLGNGDGTFIEVIPDGGNFFSGGGFDSLVLGDFNGDSKLDVIAGETYMDDLGGGAYIEFGLGNGDGTFSLPERIGRALPNSGNGVALGDFNEDGTQDIVTGATACQKAGTTVLFTCVNLFLGNGDGTFQGGTQFALGTGIPIALAVADFNADGKPDALVVNTDDGDWGNVLSILLGNGDGTFQTHVDYTTGGSVTSVAVGDFNGDGKLDLAVTNKDANTVSILLGNGDGTFR